ncbi:putative endonuclease [Lachnospiraceae bacterium]|nr:putative endonuclease [Lachnospiraceae bacterium]
MGTDKDTEKEKDAYVVYMLECADGTYYTGITTDPERRLKEHNFSEKGAKYTRARRPVKMVYTESFPDRSSASKREWEIKHKFTRADKQKLVYKTAVSGKSTP